MAWTGRSGACRTAGARCLTWRSIGDSALNLDDVRTGPRTVQLGEAARAIIEVLPGPRNPDAFLFPRHTSRPSPTEIVACWRGVCEDAGPGRLRLHDLRHTAARHVVVSRRDLVTRGQAARPPGGTGTAAGCAHLADGQLVETAEKAGSPIAEATRLQSVVPPSCAGTLGRHNCWFRDGRRTGASHGRGVSEFRIMVLGCGSLMEHRARPPGEKEVGCNLDRILPASPGCSGRWQLRRNRSGPCVRRAPPALRR